LPFLRARSQWLQAGIWAAVVAAVVIVPLAGASPFWTAAIVVTMIYVPSAVGQNLILGNAGLLAMGQAAFVGTGAYTAGVLAVKFQLDGAITIGAAVVVSGLLGALVGIPALRIGGDYLFIVSLGFNLIVLDVALQWQPVTGGATGLTGVPVLTLFGQTVSIGNDFYFAVLIIVLLSCAITYAITSSRFGRTVEGIRDDEIAAVASGIAPARPKVIVFAIGAALAGLSGALLAYYLGYVGYTSFNVNASILIFEMAVIGGLGRVTGSVVGTVIIIMLPELLRPLQSVRDLLGGVIIIILMIVRPEGLLGKTKITNLIKK
jgi:branched-chain amino acid transport system permease protein